MNQPPSAEPLPVLLRVPKVAADRGRGPRRTLRCGWLTGLVVVSAAPLAALVLHIGWQWYLMATKSKTLVGPWPVAGVRRPVSLPTGSNWQEVATIDAEPERIAPGQRLGHRPQIGDERR